jgi:hypothetical protein
MGECGEEEGVPKNLDSLLRQQGAATSLDVTLHGIPM